MIAARAAVARRRPGYAYAAPGANGGSRLTKEEQWALWAGIILFSLVAARLGDFFPMATRLKPVMLSLVLYGLYVATNHRRMGANRVTRDTLFKLIVLYYLWILASTPFAIWVGGAFRGVKIGAMGVSLAFAVALVPARPAQLKILQRAIAVVTAVSAALAVNAGTMEAGRVTTPGLLDPNDLASLLAAAVPFAMVAGTSDKSKKMRLAAWGLALVMCIVLLQTGSRGGILALAIAVLVVVSRMNFRRTIAAVVMSAALGPAVWTVTPPELQERFSTLLELEDDYNMTASYGRIATWKRGIIHFSEAPLTGVGWGNFGTAEGRMMQSLNIQGQWLTAHNILVQAFVELGIPGGTIFLAMMWVAFGKAIRLWRDKQPEYLASLCAFLTGAMFLSHAYSYTLFAILGLLIAASHSLRAGPGRLARQRPRRRVPAPHGRAGPRMPAPVAAHPVRSSFDPA